MSKVIDKQADKQPGSLKIWWYRLTAPPGTLDYSAAPTRHQRERLRHAGLASSIAPIVSLTTLLVAQQASDTGTLIAMLICVICPLLALLLFNRRGHQVLAALCIIGSMEAAIEVALLTTVQGGLSPAWLPTFCLFVLPLIAAGVLLSRKILLLTALLNICIILGDYFFLPHSADLNTLIVTWHGPLVALARPIIIQIVGGICSVVQIGSTNDAIARGDRAEELVAYQQRVAEEKKHIEDAATRLRDVMVQVANGDQNVSVPIEKGSVLWEVGNGLQLLLLKLRKAAVMERQLQTMEAQLLGLTNAVNAFQRHIPPTWPRAANTPVDPLIQSCIRLANPTKPHSNPPHP